MSSADTTPISSARFASALKDLSISMLHLKVLEIRNSIAHLQYSNDQLKPFAEGTAVAITQPTPTSTSTSTSTSTPDAADASTEPDQDCIDAIRENEQVIDRMAERIALIRAEVEERGMSWTEFQSKEELEQKKEAAEEQNTNGDASASPAPPSSTTTNGHADGAQASEPSTRHSAWADGTFQTGTISGGQLHFDSQAGRPVANGGASGGGSLSDDQLRAALEERLRNLGTEDDEEDGGLHL